LNQNQGGGAKKKNPFPRCWEEKPKGGEGEKKVGGKYGPGEGLGHQEEGLSRVKGGRGSKNEEKGEPEVSERLKGTQKSKKKS